MNGTNLYALLEKVFVATFLDELIPGIFHNLANPLNGIMGRSKLMQRRLVDFVKKLENRYPAIEDEMGADYRKLISDIDAINHESERFFDMFRISTGKLYAIDAHGVEKLNLSSLIEAELGFADFYLDFKHNIKKEVHLDREAPDIEGITAFYSMAIWSLIRQAMNNITDRNNDTFRIATDHDDQWVILMMHPIGNGALQGGQDVIFPVNEDPEAITAGPAKEKNLIYALMLLQQGSDGVKITHDGDKDMLTIRVPYQQRKGRLEKQS